MYMFESLKSDSKDERIAEMLNSTQICLNCYKPLDIAVQTIGYCNRQCMLQKPPKMAIVEKEYQKPIKEVLIDGLRMQSIQVLSHLLGIDVTTMYDWCRKLGIDLNDPKRRRLRNKLELFKDDIIQDYCYRRVKVKDIAAKYKCSERTLYTFLNKYGITKYREKNGIRVVHSWARCGRTNKNRRY